MLDKKINLPQVPTKNQWILDLDWKLLATYSA